MTAEKKPNRIRRNQFKLYLSDEERYIIENKAAQYGYNTIVAYMRDACMYENIFVEDVNGRNDIIQEFSQINMEFKKVRKECNLLNHNPIATATDIHEIKEQLLEIEKDLKDIRKDVEDKLSVTFDRKKIVEDYNKRNIIETNSADNWSTDTSQCQFTFNEDEKEGE